MARYWIGGSGNWSDTSHWSTSSGGSGGASVPGSSDDVVFDSNSLSSTSTITGDGSAKSIDTSAIGNLLSFSGILSIYGNVSLNSSTTLANLKIRGTSTFSANGASISQFGASVSGWTGTIDLGSDLTCGTISIGNNLGLTFNTNDYDITVNSYSKTFSVSSIGTLNLGSSTITCYNWYITPFTTVTLNAGTSTILLNGNGAFTGGGLTYATLSLMADTTIKDSNTIGTLEVSAGKTVSFEHGKTQVVNNFSLPGIAPNVVLQSDSSGSQWYISKSSGTVTLTHVSIQDSNATGGATWQAGSFSINLGNNTGWAFVGTLSGPGSTSITMGGNGSYTKGRFASGSASIIMTSRAASGSARIETNASRKIVQSTQFSWNKNFVSTYTLFTIGASTIGGGDFISSSGAISSDWNKYIFSDESDYVTQLNYQQEFNMPLGGLIQSLGDIQLDNTTKRFTPDYMGGNGELFTSVYKSRRPLILNAGFNYNGVDNMEPQLVGLTNKPPAIDTRQASADFNFTDFIDYISNKYVDETAMYTGYRSDQLIEQVLLDLGFATAQYSLDTGINVIPFAYFPAGSKFGGIVNDIVQAENAHMYQDVNGVIRFENRQHWNNAPYTYVQRNITTSMVIEASSPSNDHIINTVEINSTPYNKQATAEIYSSAEAINLDIGANDVFINFENPVLQASTPVFTANTQPDGAGTDITSNVSITSEYVFAQAAKYRFVNNSGTAGYITSLTVDGREATPTATPIYYRTKDDSSVTAYDERAITISNNYIQSLDWAKSFSALILNDFSDPDKLQTLTIRAIPGLKISDLISWQGRNWRIYGIKTTMNPSVGFIQELSLLQRDVISYFRIGVSLIGGNDGIAP